MHYPDEPIYSEKYNDDAYEYRHVVLPKHMARECQSISVRRRGGLLSEKDWRSVGIQQSRGWQHYMVHRPEPHILLFRRPLGTDPLTGKVCAEWKAPNDSRNLANQ